jgi:hypothetical protein
MGDWCKKTSYRENNLVRFCGSVFICICKVKCCEPTDKKYWSLLVSSIRFLGRWGKIKNPTYLVNDIVRYDTNYYICIQQASCNVDIHNKNYWKVFIEGKTDSDVEDNDSDATVTNEVKPKSSKPIAAKIKSRINETYNADVDYDNSHGASLNITDNIYNIRAKSKDQESEHGILTELFDDIHPRKALVNMVASTPIMYIGKKSDIKYAVNKKTDGYVPIQFDTIMEMSSNYHTTNGHLIFNRAGLYKITCHVLFSGIGNLKTKAYLLHPNDNIKGAYTKDRKVINSKMSVFGSSVQKNHLHYDFIVRVKDVLSTLVLVASHKARNASIQAPISTLIDDKEITIYGKNKTWLLAAAL